MTAPRHFQRTDLAKKLSGLILDDSAISSARSGVFLAAPRRTGKSTFVREDLASTLTAGGAVVIYADLWEDKSRDPGEVIASAIRDALSKNDGAVKRLTKSLGLESISLGGVKVALGKGAEASDVTLSSALAALSDEVEKPIVLIIDEAQHAITTKEGDNALFALKAARDNLNSSQHHGLRIVATGSNRNKLAMLIGSKDQAFFGAHLLEFPNLDFDFVEWLCKQVKLPESLDPKQVMSLFEKSGYRPEILFGAVDAIRFELTPSKRPVADRFAEAVRDQITKADEEKLPVIKALTPIQSAVLRVMAQMGKSYGPFEAKTLVFYDAAMKEMGVSEKSDNTSVQSALQALQDKGLIWRARRGAYDLEDSSIIKFLPRVEAIDNELNASPDEAPKI